MSELTFTCEACGKVIASDDGALCMKASELKEAIPARKLHPAENVSKTLLTDPDLAELLVAPRASWRAYHYRCADMDEAASGYRITLDRLETYRDLVAWTAHLMEKTWLPHTNWRAVLTSQVGHSA